MYISTCDHLMHMLCALQYNFRRSIQLNHCGFHAAVHRPYKELGPVEMNNGRLILEGLGQSDSQEQV